MVFLSMDFHVKKMTTFEGVFTASSRTIIGFLDTETQTKLVRLNRSTLQTLHYSTIRNIVLKQDEAVKAEE